jgi:hypothetical protein
MIGEVEDAIEAKVKEVLGDRIRAVETLPAALDAAELKRRLRVSPAVYIAFLGGTARGENAVVIDGSFAVYFLVSGKAEESRRRGSPINAKGGAYALIEAVLPNLQGLVVKGVGSLTLGEVSNLFADELDNEGITLFAATFTMPLTLRLMNADEIGKFLDFHADWIVPPHPVPPQGTVLPDGDADTSDDVQLPQ